MHFNKYSTHHWPLFQVMASRTYSSQKCCFGYETITFSPSHQLSPDLCSELCCICKMSATQSSSIKYLSVPIWICLLLMKALRFTCRIHACRTQKFLQEYPITEHKSLLPSVKGRQTFQLCYGQGHMSSAVARNTQISVKYSFCSEVRHIKGKHCIPTEEISTL